LKRSIGEKRAIDEALKHINEGLTEKGLTAFDENNPKCRSKAVDATLTVSLKALSKEECALYYELAIFPEDIKIYLKLIEKLWNKTRNFNIFSIKELCKKFYNMSLLQTYDTERDFIKLHDVVREYLEIKNGDNFLFYTLSFLKLS
jgi:hypothetical protein